jgi:hypothetical protein
MFPAGLAHLSQKIAQHRNGSKQAILRVFQMVILEGAAEAVLISDL